MIVTVPDHIVLPYMEYADKTGRTLNGVISAQLERFKALQPGRRCIVVPLDEAEKLLGGLPIQGEVDLLYRVSQLASISYGGVKLELSIAQLKELEHRASRQGKSVQSMLEGVARELEKHLFWGTGGGAASEPQAKVG